MQVLDSAKDERFSLVAVHLLSAAGSVQLYMLSGSAALCAAAKARATMSDTSCQKQNSDRSNCFTFQQASCRGAEGAIGACSALDLELECAATITIPSTEDSTSELPERVRASIIEQRGVVGKFCPDSKMGDFLELPIQSVVVRVQGVADTTYCETVVWPNSCSITASARLTYAQVVAKTHM